MGKTNEEIQRVLKCESGDDGIYYLSGKKPFFGVVFSRSQVSLHFQLWIPVSMVPHLPRAHVTVVLRHGGKNWKVGYTGNRGRPGFEPKHWKVFVMDNNLKIEDGCVFELIENNPISGPSFKVHIMRSQWSLEVLAELDARDIRYHGDVAETPILVD